MAVVKNEAQNMGNMGGGLPPNLEMRWCLELNALGFHKTCISHPSPLDYQNLLGAYKSKAEV